jgi:Asp-tRNA(Asn)/Glu-tRNA(Gln) amidotransferase A subunit family amidase
MFLLDLFIIQASLCGSRALSFPAGKSKNGLPFGFQLMAADFQEEKLMSFVNDCCNF